MRGPITDRKSHYRPEGVKGKGEPGALRPADSKRQTDWWGPQEQEVGLGAEGTIEKILARRDKAL